ncbi:tetratricopeptide repeat protein [Limnothrix sp. FACHB-881]|uniref:tetratricopeptide repeat protein n=1 Tax=Limnothrix sp. FACHB-881 TaxID=2692819 RepID=UPI0016857A28|nr:tetratricopeptide repeat protein [Limnothrix sp. FACHB-881]MBD2635696.1 tetratricopeptide repeat protein [Limnothrix sp. FACHB-881]
MSRPPEIDRVIEAFKNKDYRTAARLLNPLLTSHPRDPWVQLYAARLHELAGRPTVAEPIYRELLKNTTNPNPKILAQARQGLQRLETADRTQRQAAITQARAAASQATHQGTNQGDRLPKPAHGILILEPIASDNRPEAAKQFARIFDLDPYTARMQLPSRDWRLYRTGLLGELQVYAEALQSHQIPCFCVDEKAVQAIKTFTIKHFQSVDPDPIVICENDRHQLGTLAFRWAEVSQRVLGAVPVVESVIDLNARGQIVRRDQTQDWVPLVDLHLPDRGCILRLCESAYQFDRGVAFAPMGFSPNSFVQELDDGRPTRRTQWNALVTFVAQQTPIARVFDRFTGFAETALDYRELLDRLNPQIPVPRRNAQPMREDAAFALYSRVSFCRPNSPIR